VADDCDIGSPTIVDGGEGDESTLAPRLEFCFADDSIFAVSNVNSKEFPKSVAAGRVSFDDGVVALVICGFTVSLEPALVCCWRIPDDGFEDAGEISELKKLLRLRDDGEVERGRSSVSVSLISVGSMGVELTRIDDDLASPEDVDEERRRVEAGSEDDVFESLVCFWLFLPSCFPDVAGIWSDTTGSSTVSGPTGDVGLRCVVPLVDLCVPLTAEGCLEEDELCLLIVSRDVVELEAALPRGDREGIADLLVGSDNCVTGACSTTGFFSPIPRSLDTWVTSV
jgi:hypothetical protein